MKSTFRRRLIVDALESRLALASASVNYTDIDGDLVRITATVPGQAVPPPDGFDAAFTDGNPDGQLATLRLIGAGFNGARVGFSVTRVPGGDGLAHVGFINASGIDLDRVVVKGDLGKIVAGDGNTSNDPGLNLLQARSMGTLGLVTQGGVGDLNSTITGKLGALKVAGNFTDTSILATAPTSSDGQIGSVYIGGDLTGGALDNSGLVVSTGAMGDVYIGGNVTGGAGRSTGFVFGIGAMGDVFVGGSVTGGAGENSGAFGTQGPMRDARIGGDIIGGTGDGSGVVFSHRAMGNVRIGGDVTGGSGLSSGVISSMESIGTVRIVGDLTGGSGDRSGLVLGLGSVRGVTIGGDVIGGSAFFSGSVGAGGVLGPVRIGGDLIGGSVTGSDFLSGAGQVFGNRIASVTIGGSLVAGIDASTGSLSLCGAIVSKHDLGPVRIGGGILGNSTNPAIISARGRPVKPAAGFDVAIASISVGGDVRFAQILAGYDGLTPANAVASIGLVTVGGDWVASSLVAGARDTGARGFGTGDTLQTANDTPLVARIAGITIRGDATGSLIAGDHFGFVAQRIDGLKIGSRTLPLTAANDNVAVPFTNDLRLFEVG